MIHVLGAARAVWLRDVKAKAREMRLKRERTDHVGLVDTGKGNLQRALTVEGHYPFSIFLKGLSGSYLENKYLRLRKSRGRETGESVTGERGWWLDGEVGSKECIKGMTSVYLGGDQVSLVD